MRRTVLPTPIIYELGEILGQGANGSVFKATRHDSSRQIRQSVAVKVLNSKKSVGPWRQEFDSLARVNSKFCVRVFGFEWLNDQPALILELVDGISLAELRRYSNLQVDEIRCIAGQIAAGLKDLSNHGMCHGDLSPANALIDREGQVRLVDFGFGNTAEGRRRVTPAFAAPEILAGAIPDKFSDLWSLGKLAEYLGGDSSTTAGLLLESPVERRWRGSSGLGAVSVRRRLRSKVRLILDHRRAKGTPTRTYPVPRARISRSVAAMVFLALLTGLHSSAGYPAPKVSYAQVLIRSQFGIALEWQGRPIGYAPLDLLRLEPGDYELRWTLGNRVGQRTLTLRPGDSIVLDDKTFAIPGHRRGSF